MIEIIKPGTRFPFIANARKVALVSGALVLASILLLGTRGLNLGIDFKGGNKLIVAFVEGTDVDASSIKSTIGDLIAEKRGDAGQIEVQSFDVGDTDAEGRNVVKYQIYTELTSLLTDDAADQIIAAIEGAVEVKSLERPKETDKFILVLKEPANISETKDLLLALLGVAPEAGAEASTVQGLGYSRAAIVSEEERALDMEFYKEYNLSVVERTKEGGTIPDDDFEIAFAAHSQRKRDVLKERVDQTYTISLQQLQADVEQALVAKFGKDNVSVESSTSVSPSVGRDLFDKGILAMIYAIIGILIYIGLRFDFRYSPGAVVALIHDTLITLGIFSLFGIKFTLPIISALLTIIGYSLNDTIVVYDRIRENLTKFKGMDLRKLINQSINETLSRTILTSVTTLFVVLALLFVGGGLIADFALALTIGIVVGTYSSVFVASPMVIVTDEYLQRRRAKAQRRGQAHA